MKPLHIQPRAVFYKEEGYWVVHCLEFDLLGHGTSKRKALAMLSQAIAIQIETSIKHNNPKNLFSPADGEIFAMFAAGKEVSEGKLKLTPIESITIEDIETREYSESDVGLALTEG